MRDLLLLGLDVHNAEMAEIVERVNAVRPTWNLLGYVSADGARVGEVYNGYSIYDTSALTTHYPEACVVGNEYGWKSEVLIPRERYVSLIDPSSWVSRSAQIGVGCVVFPNCYVGLRAVLGDYLFCLSGSIINHDDVLEERVVVTSGVRVAGNVHVEAHCYLGQACTIRECLRIGHHSLIGMGAVVVRDVPPHAVMVGNPARYLRANGVDTASLAVNSDT